MTREEILNHDFLKLPRDWKAEGFSSYYETVRSLGRQYLELLANLDQLEFEGSNQRLGGLTKDELLSLAKNVVSAVLKPLEVYLEAGNPHKAYQCFDERFSMAAGYPKNTAPVTALEYSPLYPEHFRLRHSESLITSIEDMFHVPFQQRHIVNSFRYSVPGYPTLYLANSPFLAQLELDVYDNENLYISKFVHKHWDYRNETVLDLQAKPLNDFPWSENRFLGRWPLIMACCLKTAYPKSPFKPEYILPQIILQWVRSKIMIGEDKRRVIGVNYSTSKICTRNSPYEGHFFNTAIPVVQATSTGFCSTLKSKFMLTKPLSLKSILSTSIEPILQGQVKSILRNGVRHNYQQTEYCKIETVLDTPPYNELSQLSI